MNRRITSLLTLLFVTISIALPALSVSADSDTAYAYLNSSEAQAVNMTVRHRSGVEPSVETKKGVTGWRLKPSDVGKSVVNCFVDDKYIYNLNYTESVRVSVTYYDDNYGGFALYYDALDGNRKSIFTQLTKTNEWITADFDLYDARLANGIDTADFLILTDDTDYMTDEQKIMGTSKYNVLISKIEVKKTDLISPYNIKAESGHFGNIFYEGDMLSFDMLFDDRKDIYTSGNASYTVKDYDGNTVYTFSAPFDNEEYKLNLPLLKFGVYTLEIEVSGGNVYQKQIVDFSYSKKSVYPNDRIGINVHFQWHAYDKESVHGMIDAAKNAGYKFLRHTIDWADTEKVKGVYSLDPEVIYGSQYADSVGMEILGILSGYNNLYGQWPYNNVSDECVKAYANFCGYVVGELKDTTNYFTMPNEYNIGPTGSDPGSPENYARLTKAAYPKIKAANPNAYVVSGAVAGLSEWFSKACFDEGILNYCDAWSMHHYAYHDDPSGSNLYANIPNIRKYINEYDDSKAAWMTENGWPSRAHLTPEMVSSLNLASDTQQACRYPTSLAINTANNRLDKYINYSFMNNNIGYFWAEDNFGIIYSHDYRTPYAAKQAYISTAAYNSIIEGYTECVDLYNTDQYSPQFAQGDYTNAKFAYAYKMPDGSETVMFWKGEKAPDGTYTYESDKAYFEVYDMFGNREIIENTDGAYTANYTAGPVYVHATDKLTSGNIMPDGILNSWVVPSNGDIKMRFKMPVTAKTGDSASVIIAGYDKNGKLSAVSSETVVYSGTEQTLSFSANEFSSSEVIKIFAFDGLNHLKPLRYAQELEKFGDNLDAYCEKDGEKIKISGNLTLSYPNTFITVTVIDADISRADYLSDGSYDGKILYQDFLSTDVHGDYSLSFRLPEDYDKDSIRLQVSTKENTYQKVLFIK